MIKFAYLVKRVEGMTFEEFVAHHRERHAPLFASIPEAKQYVRRYTLSHPVPAEGYPAPDYDALVEIWFDDLAAHDTFFASKNYLELVRPDEGTFFIREAVSVLVTAETTVI